MKWICDRNEWKVVPIEVKSGKAYKSHKALDNFMNIPDYHLEKAYVFSVGNVETEGTVTYLPIYMCYLLKEQKNRSDDRRVGYYWFVDRKRLLLS